MSQSTDEKRKASHEECEVSADEHNTQLETSGIS
jgi:hypothetical protein